MENEMKNNRYNITSTFKHSLHEISLLIFFIISQSIIMTGCSNLKVTYISNVGNPSTIEAEASITVRFNEKGLSRLFNQPEEKLAIINAVKNDLKRNMFYSGENNINVIVFVEKLTFEDQTYKPVLWFPLWFVGAPTAKVKGEAIVSLEIYADNETPIAKYRTHKITSNWYNLYSRNYPFINALKMAMEDIKSQILKDRYKIAEAIQKEKESPEEKRAETSVETEDFDPPHISLIEPAIERGLKKVVRERTITVRGKAIDRSGIFEVRVNDVTAQLSPTGVFWIDTRLLMGENEIEILVIDNLGNRATKRFTVVRKSTSPGVALAREIDTELVTGKYYAMIIGINNYSGEWMPLKNAVHDARSVEKVLQSQYGFDRIFTLYDRDATRANIIRKLEWLADNLNEEDNLLIYYSGHGEFKENLNKGYWVPVDSKSKSTVNYISNSDLQTFLNGIPTQHTLLVSDACFSGDIFRSRTESISPDDYNNINRYYREVNRRMSRQALTSGGIEPVMDGGREGHSVFTYYFLKALKQNDNKYYDVAQIFNQLKIPVANNSEQTPILQAVKNTGDEGGQFIFIRK